MLITIFVIINIYNLENDLESLTPIESEILHKHNINAYTHKRHMKNMGNTSN